MPLPRTVYLVGIIARSAFSVRVHENSMSVRTYVRSLVKKIITFCEGDMARGTAFWSSGSLKLDFEVSQKGTLLKSD